MRNILVRTSCARRIVDRASLRMSGHLNFLFIKSHLPPSSVYSLGHILPHGSVTLQCLYVRFGLT